MPKVSVVVPVYNVSEYLGQCLDTILLQTLQDIEVICVDDGSTDGSLDILNTYAFLDARLKVISQKNAGAGAARNRGLKEATGEFIMFLDSDDFFKPDMLEKMVQKAEEDGSDVVVCGHYIYDNNVKQMIKEIKIEEKYLKKSPAKPEDFGKELFYVSNMGGWNKLIRVDIIKNHHLSYDEHAKYAEDLYMTSFVLACSNKISLLKNCFVYYRINQNTSLSAYKSANFKDYLYIVNKLYVKLEELNLSDKFEKAFNCYIPQGIRWILCDSPADKKRENLKLIRQILKPEFFERIFICDNNKVSIIIPVYNAVEFLPKCLDSCLNQTLKEIEIICVDDGSTDNGLEILNEYAKRDNRIIVLQQENQRQAIARNKAMEVATGRYIQFLDADDYLELDTCECLYLYSQLFNLEMCQCTAIEFYHHNKKEFENQYHSLKWLPDDFPPVFNRDIIPNILPNMAVTACLTFYRHDFLIRNNIKWINKKIAYEDTPFFTEAILKAKRVGALKVPFYHRRVHSGATTQQIAINLNEYIEILKYTLKTVKKLADCDLFRLYCATFLQKAWGNFSQLEPNDKINMAPSLYDFCYTIQHRYHFTLPLDIYSWSLRYLNTLKKNKKEKLKFKYFAVLAKCMRNEYGITLIKWKREPQFEVSILGLPILQIQKVLVPVEEKQQPAKQDVHKITDVYYKLLGLTFLKITMKDLYE